MSFSQSFNLGDNTLSELEKGAIKMKLKPNTTTNNGMITPNRKRKHNNNNNSGEKNHHNQSGDPENVVEESPTDSSNVMYNKSIKEKLKMSSRKYMRRSKSDPITPKSIQPIRRSEIVGKDNNGRKENDKQLELKPNTFLQAANGTKTEQNRFSESIDKYFQESLDCFTQLRELEKSSSTAVVDPNVPFESEGFNSKFFESQFTIEMDNSKVNVSEIEKIVNSPRSLLPVINDIAGSEANFSSEDMFNGLIDEGTVPAHISHCETDAINIGISSKLEYKYLDSSTEHMSNIYWNESDIFNEVDEDGANASNQDAVNQSLNENIVVDGSIREDLNCSITGFIDEEIENCRLDVSLALTELVQSQSPAINLSHRLNDISMRKENKIQPILTTIPKHSSQNNIGHSDNDDICDIQNLSKWGFSRILLEEYKKKNIHKMFDWQAECLGNEKLWTEARNLVYSAPTSAGKTFVSEILMIRNVIERQKKVLVILPFISVVREKMYYLQDLLRSSGIRVQGFFGGYSPPGGFDNVDIAVCTIEKANSIVNKLLEQKKLDTIGVIVVDEIHLISDPGRGYILELLLTKTIFCSKKIGTNIQIVTMSATLPNSELLTTWLKAEYFHTDFRPVELKEMIKIGNEIFDKDMQVVRTVTNVEFKDFQGDQDNVGQLCIETILENSAVIVFCPSKDWCESLAMHVAGFIYKIGKSKTLLGERLRPMINMQLIDELKNHLKNCPTGLDTVLEKTISYGVAYHHAGLTFDERDIIESAFSNGSLRVIIATSTLSSGVNLPARRVIVRTPLFGGKQMSSLTYKQMIGRAGRTGKDTVGESILICPSNGITAGKNLVTAELKPMTSCLDSDNYAHLKRAILEIIASDMAITKIDLENFIKSTLLYSEKKFEMKYFSEESYLVAGGKTRSGRVIKLNANGIKDSEIDPIGRCMIFLEEYEFIRLQLNEDTQEMNFIATRLGHACLASSMPPSEGFLLFSELQKARQCFVMESELHAVYLVTPFSVCYQIQEIDWLAYLDMWEKLSSSMRQIGTIVGVKESFLVRAMRGGLNLDYKALQIHKRFYTALALMELVNEAPMNEVADKYKFSRGVLQSLQQMTSTFAGIVTSFCRALNWDMLALIISQFQQRLFFGVHQDLVDLMQLTMLNNQRARALHKAGFETLIDLANANVLDIEKCLFDCVCFDTKKREGESNYDAEQRNRERSLFVTGKSGISVSEAARMIINEARKYLESEMRIQNVKWTNTNDTGTVSEVATENIVSVNGPNDLVHEENKIDLDVEICNDRDKLRDNCPTADVKEKLQNFEINDIRRKSPAKPKPSVSDVLPIETDDAFTLEDAISFEDESILIQSNVLDTSHILNDKKTEPSARPFDHINIIDVCKNKENFLKMEESFKQLMKCSFSIAIEKLDPTRKHNARNCAISDETYIAGIALCVESNVVFFLNLQDDTECQVDFHHRIIFLKSVISKPSFQLEANNAKNKLKLLMRGIPDLESISCSLEDPKVAHWLLQPETENSMVQMTLLYAPECTSLVKSLLDDQVSAISPKYRASIEACATHHILRGQIQNLHRMDNGILKTFTDMEMPIQKSLLCLENTGISVDRHMMENLSLEINEHMRQLELDMAKIHGKPFRVNSKQEIARILKIPFGPSKRTISRKEIEKTNHPITKYLLQHRSLDAILAKTIQPLMKTIIGNRIYGTNTSFTSTGRISMHEPNLQCVAKDINMEFLDSSKNKTLSCRSVFKAEKGRVMISADFCQLELRILAHLSKDKSLINIFKSNEDVFTAIAAKWNNISVENVTEKQRNATKQICYGIIYGMGTKSLAAALKCDDDEAMRLCESFHKTYPGIRNYTTKIIDFARENGYVETLAYRRRYLPYINSTSDIVNRNKSERQAINTKIQGSAADIAKYAILRMERNVKKYQQSLKLNVPNEPATHVQLVLHLHDELIYEIPAGRTVNIGKILKSSMENCAYLNVPLKVKMKLGDNWGSMKPM